MHPSMKRCTKCSLDKDEVDFSPKRSGLSSRCKSCIAKYRREKYIKKPLSQEGKFKTCSMCNTSKPIDLFYKQKNCKTHRAECKKCSSSRRSVYKERVKLFLMALKDKPCMDCNQKYPYYVMDFDHKDAAIKKFNISQMRFNSREKIIEEISKCDLVCSNCHRERTFVRLRNKENETV